jgi:DNA replication factor GINS
MNLEELQSVRDRERRTDKLQELRETFYADAGELTRELHDRRDRAAERADDPYADPKVKRLTDEIEAVEQTVEALYEKRVGKLVKSASLAAADMPADTEGMTAEERQLFETLVEDIRANRQHVLDVLAGDDPDTAEEADTTGHAARSRTEPATDAESRGRGTDRADAASNGSATESVDAADVMGSGSAAEQARPRGGSVERDRTGEERPDAAGATPERETVRITDDIGPIFGVDEREYDLSEDDIVQLPAANAAPLVDRDAAERLE